MTWLDSWGPANRLTQSSWLFGAVLIWFVLIGGSELGSLFTPVRAVNTLIGAVVVALWLWRLPARADLTDALVLVALIAFLVASVGSSFPRMSFEAATTAVAFTAAFSLTRWRVAEARSARALITLLALCGLGLAAPFVVLWGSIWASWVSIEGSLPPLDLILPVGPYRHFHVVGMLFALLLPALLALTGRRPARVIGLFGVLLAALLIFMSGSRTAWLAVVLSVVVPLAGVRLRAPRAALAGLVTGSLVMVFLVTTGLLGAVAGRLATTATIVQRVEIWEDSVGRWLTNPLVGTGPGSFSASFTLGDWFERYERVGRHADNAPVQLLMEAGVLGMGTLLLLAVAFTVGVRRSRGQRTHQALMGMAIFGLMSLTDNPSDTTNLVVVGICWAALCTPAVTQPLATAWAPSWRTAALAATALTVAAATAMTLAASAAFDESQAAARAGDTDRALRALDRSVSLDPGHALYWRERGLHGAQGGRASAMADLREAIRLNPADTVGLRALAVLEMRDGDTMTALSLAGLASTLRPTHDENLITLAFVASEASEVKVARGALVDALRRMPWIAGSEEWAIHFPSGAELHDLLLLADDAERAMRSTTDRRAMPVVWLNAVAGRDGDELLEMRGWSDTGYLVAIDALLRCELRTAAGTILDGPPATPSDVDLITRIMVANAVGETQEAEDAVTLFHLRGVATGHLAERRAVASSPFWDPEEDRRLYERAAVIPVDLGVTLPTEQAGLSAWLRDPAAAARVGAPGSKLALCTGDP